MDIKKIHLTHKEYEVLKLIALGYENLEIANILNISKHTVKAHIASMLKKTNAKNRTQLITKTIINNILMPNDLEFTD